MLKAIETSYKGYRFRSRLEARWAVFFDAVGVRWIYEPEGYELPPYTLEREQFINEHKLANRHDLEAIVDHLVDTAQKTVYYLPDFFLPEMNAFAEVKGQLTYEDGDKIIRLANASGREVILLRQLDQEPILIRPKSIINNTCTLDKLAIAMGSRAEEALRLARSARFEHGEHP